MIQGKFTTNKGYSTTTDEAAYTIKKSMEMAVSILTQASQNNPQDTNAMNDNKYTNNQAALSLTTQKSAYGIPGVASGTGLSFQCTFAT
jgi:hypothetical protein